jgi:uncharacterized membrane protein YdjX (TVP38/TMEM64 family)
MQVSTSARPTLAARWRGTWRDLGLAAPLFVVACAGPLLGAAVLTATTAHWLPLFVADLSTALLFVAIGVVAAAGCLLPTHATSLVAGFVFGPLWGPVLAWFVIVLAATGGYFMWRPLVGERVVQAIGHSRRGAIVHRALLGRGFLRATWLVMLLRLSPLMPFAATNLLFAALGVGPRSFLLATLLGITPRAIAVALLGAGLSELDWSAKGSWWWSAFAVVTTGLVLVVIGRSAQAALRRELGGSGEHGECEGRGERGDAPRP